YVSLLPGMDSRLDEIQAAILLVKLKWLDEENGRRQQIARRYDEALAGTSLVLPYCRKEATHVYHQYVVQIEERDRLRQRLQSRKITTSIHYPVPIHQQPGYQHRYPIHRGKLPITENTSQRIMSLPMHPYLSDEQVERVCNEILEWYSTISRP